MRIIKIYNIKKKETEIKEEQLSVEGVKQRLLREQ